MKKYISILLVAVMLLTLMVPVMAAGVPYLSVSGAKANAGEEVTVNISLNTQNTAIRACSIKVSYSSGLTLTGFSSAQDYRESVAEGIVGFMFFASSTADVSFTATFKVDANAESGDYYVSASIIELIGEDYENISANPGTGKITVHAHTWGDYSKDASGHWQKCSCGETTAKAPHIPGPAATYESAQICTICGYVIKPALPAPHEHVWGAWAPYSEVQHMRVCATDSTHVDYANHNFVDNVCADCGYVLEIIIPDTPDEFDGLTIEELILIMMMGKCTNTITATAGEGGMISPAGATNVPFAKDQTYVITPMPGYEIDSVVVDGKDKGAINQYTFKRVLAKHTITATFKKMPWVNHFKDVKENDWFYSDVAYVNSIGLMVGTSSTEFSPNETATRAQIVTTLWRLEGQPVAQTKADFTDVAEGMWYTDAIAWAAENKIVEGYGDGIFAPGDAITREQIVAILHRYAEYKELAVAAEDEAPDAYDHSDWAADNVDWAHENGIFAGIGKDITDLTENATRAEIASYLTRFCLMILA